MYLSHWYATCTRLSSILRAGHLWCTDFLIDARLLLRLGNLVIQLLVFMEINISVFHNSSLLVCRTTTRVAIAARVVRIMRNAIPRAPCLLAVPSHTLAIVAVVDDAVNAPLSVLAGHVASAAEAIAGVGDNTIVRVAGDAFGVPC